MTSVLLSVKFSLNSGRKVLGLLELIPKNGQNHDCVSPVQQIVCVNSCSAALLRLWHFLSEYVGFCWFRIRMTFPALVIQKSAIKTKQEMPFLSWNKKIQAFEKYMPQS